MKIFNNTGFDGRTVRAVVKRVAVDMEVDRLPWTVAVVPETRKRLWYSGTAHIYTNRVVLRIREGDCWPKEFHYTYRRKELPPPITCWNWQEALAAIAGHEFEHVRQASGLSMQRGRKKYNETDTQFAEYRAWMREHERTLRTPHSGGLQAS